MTEQFISGLLGQWESLLSEGKEVSFRAGQIIAYEGHVPFGLFVLLSGEVRFSHVDNQKEQPCDEDHLTSMPQGNVIGMESLFPGAQMCCTCTAKTDCNLIFISKTQLIPLIESQLPNSESHH